MASSGGSIATGSDGSAAQALGGSVGLGAVDLGVTRLSTENVPLEPLRGASVTFPATMAVNVPLTSPRTSSVTFSVVAGTARGRANLGAAPAGRPRRHDRSPRLPDPARRRPLAPPSNRYALPRGNHEPAARVQQLPVAKLRRQLGAGEETLVDTVS